MSERIQVYGDLHYHWKTLLFYIVFLVGCLAPLLAWAGLENPPSESVRGGVGVVSGWICDAEELEVSFDDGPRVFVPYGSERADTKSVCGDTDNGFAMLMNYNNLGNGKHTLTLYVNGRVETTRTFTVVTLGEEFLRGVNGIGQIVLSDGKVVTVQWDEAIQGFKIVRYALNQSYRDLGSLRGIWLFQGTGALTFQKEYALLEMGSTPVTGGVILRGWDLEDEEPVVANLATGTTYKFGLLDETERTTAGQSVCLIYFFNQQGRDRLQGRVHLFESTSSRCVVDNPLGDPNGYPFSAQR